MRKTFFRLAGIGFFLGMIMGNLIAWFADGTLVNTRLAAWLDSRMAFMNGDSGMIRSRRLSS